MRNAISHVRHFAVIGLVMGFVSLALSAEPQSIDWSKIPTQSITLFYPGLSTYDWLLSPAHPGATLVNQGQACLTCHKGTEKLAVKRSSKVASSNLRRLPAKTAQ